jgi:S1/P1 Nuclease
MGLTTHLPPFTHPIQKAALTFAYRNSDDSEIVDGSVLDTSYYETRLEVVEKQLIAAGIRLAVTLENILNPLYVSPKADTMQKILMSF